MPLPHLTAQLSDGQKAIFVGHLAGDLSEVHTPPVYVVGFQQNIGAKAAQAVVIGLLQTGGDHWPLGFSLGLTLLLYHLAPGGWGGLCREQVFQIKLVELQVHVPLRFVAKDHASLAGQRAVIGL